MQIIERKAAGVYLIPMESKEMENRTVYLSGEINEEKTVEFVKEIIELNRLDDKKPIKVLITSPGGSVIHGLACYDAITTSKAPVWTYCIGTAYSMGAILFIAGQRRIMMNNSKVMLHQPLIGQNPGGSASSVKSLSDSLQAIKKQLMEIVCKHSKMTAAQANKHMSYDHYYNSKEAIEAGLADEVAGIGEIV